MCFRRSQCSRSRTPYNDGEHYDLEHFQLVPAEGEWRVQVRWTTYWALGQDRLASLATEAGFVGLG